MTNRVQTLRSSNANTRPAAASQQPGSLYVNFPDKQLGVIDPTQNPMDLIGVRFFSATTNYSIGDYVISSGKLYSAKVAITAGTFNASQWALISGSVTVSDTAPATPNNGDLWFDSVGAQLYVYYFDGTSSQWVVAINAGVLTAGYMPITGGTFTGPVTLNADPTVPLGAATKQYADAQLTSAKSYADSTKVAKVGDTMTGGLGIAPASGDASIALTKSASGANTIIYGYTAGNARWALDLGNANAESGSNAGSDFALYSYTDAGAYLGSPLSIIRSTGAVTLNGGLTAANPLRLTNSGIVYQRVDNNYTHEFGYNVGGIGAVINYYAGGSYLGTLPWSNPTNVGGSSNLTISAWALNGPGALARCNYSNNTGQVSWTFTGSDRKLKRNIREAADALALIMKLKVHSCDMKSPTGEDLTGGRWPCALIADEVDEVMPNAVVRADDGKNYDVIRDLPLIAALVKAVQQLTARVAQLEGAR